MDTGLYAGVAAMHSNEKRLDTIAANLANLSAHGYKRQGSVTRSFSIGTGDRRHEEIATQQSTDFTQGELERTGNPLDFALEGNGFFAIDTSSGRAYTRDGSFHLDQQGTLLSADGQPVAWDGSTGRIHPTGEAITVDASGGVRQGEASIGRLHIVDFDDATRLDSDSHGNWRAPRGLQEKPSTASVHQGAVERANVNSMDELIGMVVAQRRFENSATVLRSIDSTYKRLNQPH